jgi:putative tryptophan/tyrosine transport system substrate-binding protein
VKAGVSREAKGVSGMKKVTIVVSPSALPFALSVVGALLFGLSASVEAQQPKIPRIGLVSGSGDPSNPGTSVEAFRQGLRDLGYIEKKNILIEFRYAEGKLDRIPSLVTELVQLNVDVLVSGNLPAISAAKGATKTIPIVMVTVQDPVATGLIASLARPGGNITGLTTLARDLSGKRLELLKETVPRLSRIGVLLDTNVPGPLIGFKEYEAAAQGLKIELQSLQVQGPNPDLKGAFQAATRGRASAVITIRNPVTLRYRKQIADLAIKNRLPSMHERSDYVEAGGLVSYTTSDAENYRRAAIYVDKILRGAKPADVPVEQSTKFELVINLKTAKQIGLTIPPSVLAGADRVIR